VPACRFTSYLIRDRQLIVADQENTLFSIDTPLGFSVRTSREYWRTVLTKHPEMVDRLDNVKDALANPDEVRRSRRDGSVLLFYRREMGRPRWVVAVTKRPNGEGFLITAYRTDSVKEGERIWPV
jgi:hypothetical protein